MLKYVRLAIVWPAALTSVDDQRHQLHCGKHSPADNRPSVPLVRTAWIESDVSIGSSTRLIDTGPNSV